jgi:tetratricopeptide (TPR) repeat protein
MRFVFLVFTQLVIIVATAQKKWTAIMTQGGEAQTFNSFYTEAAVEEFIREQAKKSNVISELVYGDGKWHAVATYVTKQTSITWKWDNVFPSTWIKGEWDNGKHISKVTWGDGKWAVVMTTKDKYLRQSWGLKDSWAEMEQWFKTKWSESTKFNIIDLAWGDGKWCAVMGVTAAYEAQTYKVSEEFPSAWIQSKYNDKYNISTVEHDGKKWYVVMTKKAVQQGETILNPESGFPESKIKEQWDKERRISALVYAKGQDNNDDLDDLWTWPADTSSFYSYTTSGHDKLDKKDYEGAIRDYEKALALDKTDGTIWNNLAWARYLKGSCTDALADVNKSIAIKSTHFNNHTKASILKCQDKCAESLSFFNEAVRLRRIANGKIDDIIYYKDRAAAKRCMGNYSGALDDIELALAIEPDNAMLKKSQKELGDLSAGK